MTFLWIKSLLLSAVSPLSVALLLNLVGIALLIWNKRRKTALASLLLGMAVILLSGYGVFNAGLKQKESAHKPVTGAGAVPKRLNTRYVYVVVLGSGHVSDPRLPATSQINADSLFRLVEGVRIYRSIPGSKLILSGGPGFDTVPNARIMAAVASEIGVPEPDMILETAPKSTEEEAAAIQRRVGSASIILVTTAVHMPRAMEIFRNQGMDPMPAPTDFIFKSKTRFDPKDLFPSARNIALSEKMIYEYLGSAWHRIKRVIE